MRASSRTYDFCGMPIASDIVLPQLRRAMAAPPQCSIAVGAAAAATPPVTWFHEWRRRGEPVWLSIGRLEGQDYLLRFHGLADFILSADATRIDARPAAGLPLDTLRHLLIDQVLPLAGSRRGRLWLHASAVHIPGFGTIGFAGDTGRGKSTLAAALAARGARIVTDDCLAIDVAGGRAYAVPGYPGLRLWPGAGAASLLRAAPSSRVAHYSRKRRVHRAAARFHGARSPLRALFILSPRASAGGAATIRRCRASARPIALLRFAYVLDVENRGDLSALFGGLASVAAAVPVMRLRLRDGHSRLPAASDLIQEYAARA